MRIDYSEKRGARDSRESIDRKPVQKNRPRKEPVGIFGYLTREERWAFEGIASLTPENSIIGAGFNSGPLDMYSHRSTVRPADWSDQDRAKFFCRCRGSNG